MVNVWNPDFARSAPAFAPLREAARDLRTPAWPCSADFNRLLAARATPVVNAAGHALSFVAPAPRVVDFADKYESRIFLRGEAQFRTGDWHDVFNALAWLTFPRAKAALNERHYHALEERRTSGERHAGNRSALQDALTLLDESGVIVATSEPELGRLLAAHAWKELFWRRRGDVRQYMRFYLFGLICDVGRDFMALPLAEQLAAIDGQIAERVGASERDLAAADLTPVPLLGIPGWCADNEDERYYDNTAYFRPPKPIFRDRR